jgi:hypothetical protein
LKATELRWFLLYTGVVALKGILSSQHYSHFVLLHLAVFILLSKNASLWEWNNLAREFLCKFVTDSKIVYGVEFVVYNVHGLLHLADDAMKYGSLDNVSAFPFENYMQNMVNSKHFQLEQVC